MIYTLTLNPALDYIIQVETLYLGATNRSKKEKTTFGGKGINVSAVLAQFGIESTALGFIAGFTGDELEKRVKKLGIKSDFLRLKEGNTRINVKINGIEETEINAQGPHIGDLDLDKLFKKLDKIKSGDTLVLAGSVPPTLPNDIYQKILDRLSTKDVRFVVDTTGKLLINTLKYKPFLIKPNQKELEEIMGEDLKSNDEIVSAARHLQSKGAKNVLVSLGEKGAILVDENGEVHQSSAIKIDFINSTGAGDSMIAGFLAGYPSGYNYALDLGIAAGAATASLDSLATKERIDMLISSK